MNASVIISIIGVCISAISAVVVLIFNLKGSKRTDTKDIAREAEEKAETKILLRQIGADVSDVKSNMSTMRVDIKDLREKVIIVEQSAKSAHKRIDDYMKANHLQEVIGHVE